MTQCDTFQASLRRLQASLTLTHPILFLTPSPSPSSLTPSLPPPPLSLSHTHTHTSPFSPALSTHLVILPACLPISLHPSPSRRSCPSSHPLSPSALPSPLSLPSLFSPPPLSGRQWWWHSVYLRWLPAGRAHCHAGVVGKTWCLLSHCVCGVVPTVGNRLFHGDKVQSTKHHKFKQHP